MVLYLLSYYSLFCIHLFYRLAPYKQVNHVHSSCFLLKDKQESKLGDVDDCKKRHFYNPIKVLVVVGLLVFYRTFSAPTWLFLQDPETEGDY